MICIPSLRSTSVWVKHGRFMVLCSFLFLMSAAAQAQPLKAVDETPKDPKSSGESQVEARFTDGSIMKMALREDRIEFMTPHGKLFISTADVRRIEFAMRVPDETARKIDSAIADLGNPQFKRRETASAILVGLREKAFPAVMKATKNMDMEIANRAEEIIKKLRENVPAELLNFREFDIVFTDNSKIAGRIEGNAFKASTAQFGEVQLKLSDVHVLSVKGTEPEPDLANATAAPVNMVQYQNEIGKTYSFRVTANTGGSLWGSDVYTTDSTLATAVVHTGLLQPGQTGVIKVTIVPSPQQFIGSNRNGVSSAGYAQYPAAYRVAK
ncbi:MAG: hypothetical protein K8T89_12255 [Planctomycetes bacterium]|nr:hypothetical protein [Planctomycetota bacterium]